MILKLIIWRYTYNIYSFILVDTAEAVIVPVVDSIPTQVAMAVVVVAVAVMVEATVVVSPVTTRRNESNDTVCQYVAQPAQ